jgi:hypothetical protein
MGQKQQEGMRPLQKPQRERLTQPGGSITRQSHPAFGVIGANRVSGGAALFGSGFLHQHYVTISIYRAVEDRSVISTDYTFARGEIIEVALSYAQWATFVSTMNVGHGVPCTIQFEQGKGLIPGIELDVRKREQFEDEVKQRIAKATDFMREALAEAKTVKQRKAIEFAIGQLNSGLPWVAQMFDEHMEETTEKAKIEIASWAEQALIRTGLRALGVEDPPLLLQEEGSDAE